MPRATCRCGQILPLTSDSSEKVVCPKCGSKVRVRKPAPTAEDLKAGTEEGFIRFFCPCGRRLKVDSLDPPTYGKCPDCGQIVPVPKPTPGMSIPHGHPEFPTDEMNAVDRGMLERWSAKYVAPAAANPPAPAPVAAPSPAPPTDRVEKGLRVCPGCGRPVHLGSETCRACGSAVPRR